MPQFHLSLRPGLCLRAHETFLWSNWGATLVVTKQFDTQSDRLQNEVMVQGDQRFLPLRWLRSLVLRTAVLAWTLFGTSDPGYSIWLCLRHIYTDFDDYIVRFQLPTNVIRFISYFCSGYSQFRTTIQYAIPKVNMLYNLSCCETRFRLLCR